ncbi:hypothetical protein [Roseovarius sp. TM1035]|uniref:hypothetical protein n=1 Tax=Roseovarius sp. TM1035 TaxID=391613 RepID=UPI00056188DE|nr:hypothetical protein [Roseovarius sp. TM1035]
MRRISTVVFLGLTTTGAALAQQPLSAIEWLDEASTAAVTTVPRPSFSEPPSANTVTVPNVTVTALDAPRADAVGLLPSTTTGLPVTLWEKSTTSTLLRALSHLESEPLPAIQALYYTLLLAEANAPLDAGSDAAFLQARLKALRSFGAIEPAQAMAERAGPMTKSLFDQWFDLSLLLGQEDPACAMLSRKPRLTSDIGARIYCAARSGDWNTAALTYHSATALGTLSETDATLLALYLDPELIEETEPPEPPQSLTALQFRLFEAIGTALPTHNLPRAFAMADLRGNSGWKAEIEAAERLARTGAVPASRLLGLYTDRRPAASGGVWDRVAAIQALDQALSEGASQDLVEALPRAWRAARDQRLEVIFAELFAERLDAAEIPQNIASQVFEIMLLSEQYETASARLSSPSSDQQFLIDTARGAPSAEAARTSLQSAIAAGFANSAPPADHQALIDAGRLGEAILAAARQIGHGDRARDALPGAIATLRTLGLEDTARRAALQLLLLDPRG